MGAFVVSDDEESPAALTAWLFPKMPGRVAQGSENPTTPRASLEFTRQYTLTNSPFRCAKIPAEIGNQIGLAVKRHDRDAVAPAQFAKGRIRRVGCTLDGGAHVFPGVEEQYHIE